ATAVPVARSDGMWARVARLVMARPLISVVLSVSFLVVCALPYLRVRTGLLTASGLPESDAKQAFRILQEQFAAGLASPVQIVVDGPAADGRVRGGVEALVASLRTDGAFGPATVQSNPDGDLTLVSVPLLVAPDSRAANEAVARLRDRIVPAAFGDAP